MKRIFFNLLHQTCDWETLTGLLTAEKQLAVMELFTFTCKDNSLKLRSSLVRQKLIILSSG